LEDIAREFDITREKIEEIELKALQKLGSIRNKPDDDV
jgi:DNA-directed RNA polymerase sigma subunit (sigma70/sigma32)